MYDFPGLLAENILTLPQLEKQEVHVLVSAFRTPSNRVPRGNCFANVLWLAKTPSEVHFNLLRSHSIHINYNDLVGGLDHFLFSTIYGMSSFPLTIIFPDG